MNGLFEHAGLSRSATFVRITPKAQSKALYRRDFSDALTQFLSETAP